MKEKPEEKQLTGRQIHQRNLTLAQKARHRARLDKVEKMVMMGVTSHNEIATTFGVSNMTVIRWLREINERMRTERNQDVEDARNLRVSQLSNIYRKAMAGFEKSREENAEETVERVRCRTCQGEGTVEERPNQWEDCPTCHGKGLVVEKVVKKVKTSPGDSTFLRVAKDIVMEMAKIEGVVSPETTKLVSTRLLQSSNGAPDDLKQEIRQLYIEAPEDTVIKAMLALEELDLSRQKKKSSLPGAKVEVIDAKSNEPPRRQEQNAEDDGEG